MRIMITLLLGVALLFAGGCAGMQQEQMAYYAAIKETNTALVESIQKQTSNNAQRRVDERLAFSRAMTEASKTADPTDNAVIAFAWGFSSAQEDEVSIPGLAYPERPVTPVDYMEAGLPYANLIFPWLIYRGQGSGDSTRIVASDQATIMLESGNAGSFNSGAGDVGDSQVNNKHDDVVVHADNADDLSLAGLIGGDDGATVQPVDSGVGPGEFENCTSPGGTNQSLGSAASCFALLGYDVEIIGGLAYLDGEPWDALNNWESAKP